MTQLGELLEPEPVAALLALASAATGGSAIGLVDPTGVLVAGRSPGPIPAHVQAVMLEGRTIGAVTGDEAVNPELLALVARALELALAAARSQAARQRVEQELAIGRRIQVTLLPARFPDLDGWTFAAAYEPAREVGGDLYDVFPLRGRTDTIGLLIADVTGKGIPAALLMADVRALLHAAADNAAGPADALRRVNRILTVERATTLFVTVALLELDTRDGTLRHAIAGHEPPLVARHAGGVEMLAGVGPIMGAFRDAAFEEHATRLEVGDAVVLYTDGVTDARDGARRFFGESGLIDVVAGLCGDRASEIAGAIVEAVHRFRGGAEAFDDLTLLVAERRPEG